ncbi:hypothetical protein ASG67_04415 [Sphingomonas sp. Leaf339]|uniref:hypothetical protein n=1 Tax=Sphingomonas sp. Leaf339 TaxID=1736343 RepID=UPI0006F3FAA4|nr:hypothetical protein [Sphingomonas sp. Leaf339]KQU62341.1 hypothetical protein ASG67_04415 [Sphingomonas sp. Leaf339]
MPDHDLNPMTDGDTVASHDLRPAAPLKNASAAADELMGDKTLSARTADAKQAIRDGAGKVGQQATEKLRTLADDGKAKAGTVLDQLSQLLIDAGAQVDEGIGAQYGEYARSAAGQVSEFAETVRSKNIDDLIEDARDLVKASPAVAVGAAAAIGFVVARLIQSGVDTQD